MGTSQNGTTFLLALLADWECFDTQYVEKTKTNKLTHRHIRGFHPEALILDLAGQKHVGLDSSFYRCDYSSKENVGVQTCWRRADEKSIFLSFVHHFPHISESQSLHKHDRGWETNADRADSLIHRIISVAGCHLTLSRSLYKNRKVLSDSSFGNKTRIYSYPVWRRIKNNKSADVNFCTTHLLFLFSSLSLCGLLYILHTVLDP